MNESCLGEEKMHDLLGMFPRRLSSPGQRSLRFIMDNGVDALLCHVSEGISGQSCIIIYGNLT